MERLMLFRTQATITAATLGCTLVLFLATGCQPSGEAVEQAADSGESVVESPSAGNSEDDSDVLFLEWSDDIFTRAKREKRLVILHLGAVWCHWCHVMGKTTYRNHEIVSYVDEHRSPNSLPRTLSIRIASCPVS
ncbi:MAG: hypothetical protein CMJ78_22715 [Planctomycetaceae bacterium]|nr:hypothetical protein [Planctomycetaceae bacterium]